MDEFFKNGKRCIYWHGKAFSRLERCFEHGVQAAYRREGVRDSGFLSIHFYDGYSIVISIDTAYSSVPLHHAESVLLTGYLLMQKIGPPYDEPDSWFLANLIVQAQR